MLHVLKTSFAIGLLCASVVVPALAQDAVTPGEATVEITDPSGAFIDEFGTAFTFSLCGGGTDLCGILNDVQGDSRTEENLAFVGKQVIQAAQTAPNQWKGTVMFDGAEAAATITQTGPDSIEVEGCRAAILCQTLVFNRV